MNKIDRFNIEHIKYCAVSKRLRTTNAIAPRIYELPRLHKKDIPLRPIVSCINSPGYFMSKFLNNILQKLRPTLKYNVGDSYEVAHKIRNVVIPSVYVMVSLFTSLFTKIPQELIFNLINEHYWNQISEDTTIDRDSFLNLVTLCLAR